MLSIYIAWCEYISSGAQLDQRAIGAVVQHDDSSGLKHCGVLFLFRLSVRGNDR